MTYAELKTAMAATKIPFAEDEWKNAEALGTDYGVYALDGRDDLQADGGHAEKLAEGTVDLFIRTGTESVQVALVESAMDTAGVKWHYNSRQYEHETGLTHIEWVFYCLP